MRRKEVRGFPETVYIYPPLDKEPITSHDGNKSSLN